MSSVSRVRRSHVKLTLLNDISCRVLLRCRSGDGYFVLEVDQSEQFSSAVSTRTASGRRLFYKELDQEVRLINDAFVRNCNTNTTMHIRTLAAELLGGMTMASDEFLHQTLD